MANQRKAAPTRRRRARLGAEPVIGPVHRVRAKRGPKASSGQTRWRRPGDNKKGAHKTLQPAGWPRPKGYANGILARGDMVFVGGMIGWDAQGRFPAGFIAQTRQTLRNIAAVLAEGGARPEHITRMTWYVRDMEEYLAARPGLGAAYREVMGDHFPAMALVEVTRLVEPQARIEIEATAVAPRP
jgi:enamine deaminase RidA (YjgF/YER057c/UK114 family)